MYPAPLTKEESAENIKVMFRWFKVMIILANLAAIAIAITDNQDLPELSSKIFCCILGVGIPWLAFMVCKFMIDNQTEQEQTGTKQS